MSSCHVSFKANTSLPCHGWVQEQSVSLAELNTLAGLQNLDKSKKTMFREAFGRHCSSPEHWQSCTTTQLKLWPSPPCFSSPWNNSSLDWRQKSQSRNKRPGTSLPHIPLVRRTLCNQDCINVFSLNQCGFTQIFSLNDDIAAESVYPRAGFITATHD